VLEELGGIPAPLGRERDEVVELGRGVGKADSLARFGERGHDASFSPAVVAGGGVSSPAAYSASQPSSACRDAKVADARIVGQLGIGMRRAVGSSRRDDTGRIPADRLTGMSASMLSPSCTGKPGRECLHGRPRAS
jgi:hypothetical protein